MPSVTEGLQALFYCWAPELQNNITLATSLSLVIHNQLNYVIGLYLCRTLGYVDSLNTFRNKNFKEWKKCVSLASREMLQLFSVYAVPTLSANEFSYNFVMISSLIWKSKYLLLYSCLDSMQKIHLLQ